MTRPRYSAGMLCLALTVAGCGGVDDVPTVRVSVASSLTDAFELLAEGAAAAGEGRRIELNVGGSTTLVAQVLEGAPVDIIVTADSEAMDQLGDLVMERSTIAGNRITLLRNTEAPAVSSLDDLADPSLLVAACDPSVPCGRLTDRLLAALPVEIPLDTLEPNVRLVRERVLSGEVDLGFVYVTDVPRGDPRVEPALVEVLPRPTNDVEIGLLSDSDEARRTFDLLIAARPLLAGFGFEVVP